MSKLLNNTSLRLIYIILFTIALVGCGTSEKTNENSSEKDKTIKENPVAMITMENGDEIAIELFPNVAPNTVNNFISLIEKEYYNGLIFHRVIPGFMVQGGDPNGNGTGGPGYSIKGEFQLNGFENDLVHERGVISMARSQHPDSAGSQFFIMVENASHLDGEYAAFGQVVEGIENVDKIVSVERDPANKPLEEQKIKTIVVDKKGHKYEEPEKAQ